MGNKRRRRRPGGRLLLSLVTLVVLTGAAYGGASLWQTAQDGPPEEELPVASVESRVEARELSLPEGEESSREDALEGQASSPEESLEEPSEEPSEPQSSGQDADAFQVASTVTGDFALEGQVPLNENKVTSDYFKDAIFFGDSISTGINAYNICDTACVAAIGVAPSSALNTPYIPTKDGEKLTVLEAAKAYGARSKVYIMLGGNGLWQEKEAFVADYQKFIDAVRAQYPEATIYIQSMTPVTPEVTGTYPEVTHQKVLEYNQAIAQLAAKNKLPFVNVFEALCGPDGYLPAGVSGDGLHLSAEYYYKWFDYLKSHTVEADKT